MKHLLKLLLVLTILSQSCRPVFAGNAVITILDGQMNPLANENCVLSYFGAPHSMAGGSAVQWRTTATSGTNGVITLTNAAPGGWQVKPVDENTVSFTFLMPVTNGTIYVQGWTTASAGNTLPPDTMSFGCNASDLRYDMAGTAWNYYTNSEAFTTSYGGTIYTNSILYIQGIGYQTVAQVNAIAASYALWATNGLGMGSYSSNSVLTWGVLTNVLSYNTGFTPINYIGDSWGDYLSEGQVQDAQGDTLQNCNIYIGNGNFAVIPTGTVTGSNFVANGTFYGNGAGISNLPSSALSLAGVLTNNGLVWFATRTNAAPNFTAPNGSICTTTNGQFFVRSNAVWVLH